MQCAISRIKYYISDMPGIKPYRCQGYWNPRGRGEYRTKPFDGRNMKESEEKQGKM
jgi:hypothetical protein